MRCRHRWGVDSLCLTTLYGFSACSYCRPSPAAAMKIGTGFLWVKPPAMHYLSRARTSEGRAVALLGYGESTDGHHMSQPHPEGLGRH